jgi:hypothetical protein
MEKCKSNLKGILKKSKELLTHDSMSDIHDSPGVSQREDQRSMNQAPEDDDEEKISQSKEFEVHPIHIFIVEIIV